MAKYMDPMNGDDKLTRGRITFSKDDGFGKTKNVTIGSIGQVLASNKIFSRADIQLYTKFSRFGYLNPYDHEQYLREYLFFTRPDLNLIASDGVSLANKSYISKGDADSTSLANYPYFQEMLLKQYNAMATLQSSTRKLKTPFMNILTNTVNSRLDLPEINAESHESTPNIMGYTMASRGHSLKSGMGVDFNLQFNDSSYLEVYNLAKMYDMYMNLIKTGEHTHFKDYIANNIDPSQFSIYKFLIGEDGETIMYWAKVTGVYINNVPRSDMADPTNFGQISLGFHGFDVDDSNPTILVEFNKLVYRYISKDVTLLPMKNKFDPGVNNTWGKLPIIMKYQDDRSRRRAAKGSELTSYDYRLKWIK